MCVCAWKNTKRKRFSHLNEHDLHPEQHAGEDTIPHDNVQLLILHVVLGGDLHRVVDVLRANHNDIVGEHDQHRRPERGVHECRELHAAAHLRGVHGQVCDGGLTNEGTALDGESRGGGRGRRRHRHHHAAILEGAAAASEGYGGATGDEEGGATGEHFLLFFESALLCWGVLEL